MALTDNWTNGASGSIEPEAKLAQRVADEIERDILGGGRQVGDSLGTEAELSARYGVGRSVMREALVLVARDGLAEMRRGNVGGLIVSAPSERHIASSLQTYLDLVVTSFEEHWRIKRELEDLALTLAIDRFEAEDIAKFDALEAQLDAAVDERARLRLGGTIMRTLAGTARNPYLSVLIAAFAGLTYERFARSRAQLASLLAHAEEIYRLRREQLSAVMGADLGRAMVAGRQIYELYDAIAALPSDPQHPDPGDEPAEWDLASATASPQKLAEKVARAIKNRVVSERLTEGAHLGSEPELIAAYGVSRGVLREAIRILERQSVVRMVRGKGGGLRVSAPRPVSVVKSASVYLRALNIRQRSLQEVGRAMGLVAAELAARNAAGWEPQRLQARLAALASARAATVRELAFAHFNVLGDLSGSRAIGLVMSIGGNLYALDESEEADQIIVREVLPERLRDLVAAIATGDPDLARRRMFMLQRAGARGQLRPLAALAAPELLNVLDRKAEPG